MSTDKMIENDNKNAKASFWIYVRKIKSVVSKP